MINSWIITYKIIKMLSVWVIVDSYLETCKKLGNISNFPVFKVHETKAVQFSEIQRIIPETGRKAATVTDNDIHIVWVLEFEIFKIFSNHFIQYAVYSILKHLIEFQKSKHQKFMLIAIFLFCRRSSGIFLYSISITISII